MTTSPDPAVLRAWLDNHRRFLAFLERRTGSRAEAEDVLQDAFVRALDRGGSLRADESAVAWFYRLLRNTLVDRRRAAETRERLVAERASAADAADDPELRAEACRCVLALVGTLRPEHAELVRRVDLEGEPVQRAAAAVGVSPNLGRVRLHRARKALLREVQRSCRTCAEHGCLDCTCAPRANGGADRV